MTYETPKVSDYGDLAEMTAATGSGTVEDGGDKHPGQFTTGSNPTP
jgi:hypothetical protein